MPNNFSARGEGTAGGGGQVNPQPVGTHSATEELGAKNIQREEGWVTNCQGMEPGNSQQKQFGGWRCLFQEPLWEADALLLLIDL